MKRNVMWFVAVVMAVGCGDKKTDYDCQALCVYGDAGVQPGNTLTYAADNPASAQNSCEHQAVAQACMGSNVMIKICSCEPSSTR
jgi:hypothetical protein